MDCAAIIPCFNEADTIRTVVRNVRKHVHSVWVIDDGSRDDTAAQAQRAGATVIRSLTNRGKGHALRLGLNEIAKAGFRWALMLDGDGQHDPGSIPGFFEAAHRGADLVIGNRMGQLAEMTFPRRCANRWMSARLSTRLGRELPDSQCGFRLLRLDLWRSLELRRNRYEVESEMLAAFVQAGAKVEFVPIPCIAAARPSRINPAADTLRWFLWWLSWPLT
jgi:glycosyltransferase involved in cell wall biosynthesis